MTHPLTDSDGLYDPKVRDRKKYGHLMWLNGADWQLEQDQKTLEDFLEEFSCRGHSADAILDLRMFVENFKSYMRPTKPTQEDNQ